MKGPWSRIGFWIVGYGLLLVAWIGGNPPGSAPDEPQHHIKAVGVAYGHRYATRQFYANIPTSYEVCQLLSVAGVCGQVLSMAEIMDDQPFLPERQPVFQRILVLVLPPPSLSPDNQFSLPGKLHPRCIWRFRKQKADSG